MDPLDNNNHTNSGKSKSERKQRLVRHGERVFRSSVAESVVVGAQVLVLADSR